MWSKKSGGVLTWKVRPNLRQILMYQPLFSSRTCPGKPEKDDKADQAKAGKKLEEVALSSNMIGLMYQGHVF